MISTGHTDPCVKKDDMNYSQDVPRNMYSWLGIYASHPSCISHIDYMQLFLWCSWKEDDLLLEGLNMGSPRTSFILFYLFSKFEITCTVVPCSFTLYNNNIENT